MRSEIRADYPPDQAASHGAMSEMIPRPDAHIDVSAQLISLEPGLFTVTVFSPRELRTVGGMVLPAVRLDPLPPTGFERAYVSSLSESPLLTPSAPPLYVRIAGGRTSLLLTTYKASGPMPPPEIHINIVEPPAPRAATPAETAGDALPSAVMKMMVHVQNHGDMHFTGGVWAAASEADAAIEGFSITLGSDLPPEALEYRAVLGQDWFSPWMEAGEFCGSRQMALPLLGVIIRLRGPAAAAHRCRVWGRFSGAEHGPFEDGAPCRMDGLPLTGLRVVIVPKGGVETEAPPEKAEPKPRLRRK
jgi:hypothetical protein